MKYIAIINFTAYQSLESNNKWIYFFDENEPDIKIGRIFDTDKYNSPPLLLNIKIGRIFDTDKYNSSPLLLNAVEEFSKLGYIIPLCVYRETQIDSILN